MQNPLNEQNQTETIRKAEQWIRRTASMIGHNNAKMLMDLCDLAKMQKIEIEKMTSYESYAEFISDEANYTRLVFENNELTNFKRTTEEVVGDVILELIESKMADK